MATMPFSIGDDINTATRSHHTTLNQSILHLLPLALPPHTSSPHLYALGISNFLPIYSAFESSFRSQLSLSFTSPQTSFLLHVLHIPALERAAALQHDLHTLLPSQGPTLTTSPAPELESFIARMQDSLSEKPHLLVSYTWIFYMALFSGGRYIRSKLRAAYSSPLSLQTSQGEADKNHGLSFWNFPGEQDGEDLKLDFKRRMLEVSTSLTPEQREDIVAEGVWIMKHLTAVVLEVSSRVPAQVYASHLRHDDTLEERGSAVIIPTATLARIRPPWLLLLRSLFPLAVLDLLSVFTGRSSGTHNAAITGAVLGLDGK
ncbi:MAG: hypothetical protein Q9214_005856 [Letrouitia sp. 1 TL-2023]